MPARNSVNDGGGAKDAEPRNEDVQHRGANPEEESLTLACY